ncbi:hypothetical protein [Luteibacter aegosomatissinici]|uniref:hypothetical protein n=1 Tax=Luteibacter aegosomatissinici TaxID=2911539 RepID=UPI001FFB98DC|nr:hypothetical protein [Luteibacter aegosomatissinici]UPG95105.1 hypothetical protein L2Y97_03080 [Luteibacter aegosomatissinici]
MRTFIRSAVAFVAIALSFASVSAMAVTTQGASLGHANHAVQAFVPVNCKNPAECSVKFR